MDAPARGRQPGPGAGVFRPEHTPVPGAEFGPSTGVPWTPAQKHLCGSARTRTVQPPPRLPRDFLAPGQPPFFLAGGPDFRSEVSNVLEVGYRAQPTPALSY